jgi:uncharacterized protein with NRDE domain
MCTLVVLHRCTPDADLWIAANRDEYLDRAALGPAVRAGRAGAVIAPLDQRAGGTWWGLNRERVFAAVTNRPSAALDPTRRSRGQLVLDALEAGSARRAAERAAAIGPGRYNPFNLFVADPHEAFAVVYERGARLVALAPGVHVIGNGDPDAREIAKIGRTLAQAESVASGPSEGIERGLAAICRSHEGAGDPRASTCIHGDVYGTRCSTLLRLGGAGGILRHAEGPPCTTAYRDFTPLLVELDHAVGPRPGELAERKAS